MKKGIAAALLLVCVLMLFGCGKDTSQKTQKASDDVTPYAEKAIEIIDDYINFTLSASEAESKISELYNRMSKIGINAESSNYNDADKTVDSEISSLSKGGVKNKADVDLQKSRDIIAYQIGKELLNNQYTPDPLVNGDANVVNSLGLLDLNAYWVSIINTDDGTMNITLWFDKMYGTSASELYEYIEKIGQKAGCDINVHITYFCFDQPGFNVSIFTNDGEIKGFLYYYDNKSEFINFMSQKDLQDVLKEASAYFK